MAPSDVRDTYANLFGPLLLRPQKRVYYMTNDIEAVKNIMRFLLNNFAKLTDSEEKQAPNVCQFIYQPHTLVSTTRQEYEAPLRVHFFFKTKEVECGPFGPSTQC